MPESVALQPQVICWMMDSSTGNLRGILMALVTAEDLNDTLLPAGNLREGLELRRAGC